MLEDALSILDALGVPAERVLVFGRSVGSLYALHVAASRPVGGLIPLTGIADVAKRLLLCLRPEHIGVDLCGFSDAMSDRFDHQSTSGAARCPSLLLHACHDRPVDVSHGERQAHWRPELATLPVLPHDSLNDIFAQDMADTVAALRDFN